jgi:hypothetical protein
MEPPVVPEAPGEGLGLIAIEEAPDRKRVIINRGVKSRC